MEKSLQQIISSANIEYYLLTTVHEHNSMPFELNLTNCQNAWKGYLHIKDLEALAKRVEMTCAEYITITRDALTKNRTEEYEYDVKECDDQNVVLFWKQTAADDVKFQLGSITLKRAATSAKQVIDTMLQFHIVSHKSLLETIKQLEADNARLASEREKGLKLLEKCIQAKEQLELEMYNKFAVVLNAKKAKIRDLKEEIRVNSMEISKKEDGDQSDTASYNSSSSENSPMDEDYNERSDPCTSDLKLDSGLDYGNQDINLSKDESLLLEDKRLFENSQPHYKRRNKRPDPKTHTNLKAVLPRAGQDSKSSVKIDLDQSSFKKRASSNSSASSTNTQNLDDLLNNLA